MIRTINLRRFWLVTGVALVAAVIYLSIAPRLDAPDVPGGDKVGHFVAYGAVMLWFMQAALSRGSRALIGLTLVALGIALEFVQAGIPGRSFEIADMFANSIGVAIGWLAAPPRTPNFLAALSSALARGTAR
ncbi:MAG TPA: VanZ family protein [Burkholderiales bacterium]|nr:VanZ family protein [Burkholderiales bacterium]